jgi:hypothetical protein
LRRYLDVTMTPIDGKSRLRVFERNVELELEPLELRDTIGLTLIFASLCIASCGGVLFYGSGWLHVHGDTGWIGLALILGGGVAFGLTAWWLQPHKAVRHASHRLRHHARKLRPQRAQPVPAMTDAEFDAVEDALDDQR